MREEIGFRDFPCLKSNDILLVETLLKRRCQGFPAVVSQFPPIPNPMPNYRRIFSPFLTLTMSSRSSKKYNFINI